MPKDTIHIKVDSAQMDAAIEKAERLKEMAQSVEREMNAACDAIERFMALADEFEEQADLPDPSGDGAVEVETFGGDA